MPRKHRIATFTDRYPLLGPIVWMLSVQYYITQLMVGLHFTPAYSLRQNTISDLGNTMCGPYGQRLVCSPLHSWMNASFIVLGLTMAGGSLLIYQEFKKNHASLLGFSLMTIAGLGTLLVGLFPENTVSILHFSGALLPFVFGNIGMVVLARALALPRMLSMYTLLSGVVALIALIFFVTKYDLGLGNGGMERLVAYPQSIWLIMFGLYMSRRHFSHRSTSHR